MGNPSKEPFLRSLQAGNNVLTRMRRNKESLAIYNNTNKIHFTGDRIEN